MLACDSYIGDWRQQRCISPIGGMLVCASAIGFAPYALLAQRAFARKLQVHLVT
jgi:hypothetical protein